MGKYKKKTDRQTWSKESMKKATEEVSKGAFIRTTATKYTVPQSSLRRYVTTVTKGEALPASAGRFRNTFTLSLMSSFSCCTSMWWLLTNLWPYERDVFKTSFRLCRARRNSPPLLQD